jgi:cell division protein FtsN
LSVVVVAVVVAAVDVINFLFSLLCNNSDRRTRGHSTRERKGEEKRGQTVASLHSENKIAKHQNEVDTDLERRRQDEQRRQQEQQQRQRQQEEQRRKKKKEQGQKRKNFQIQTKFHQTVSETTTRWDSS